MDISQRNEFKYLVASDSDHVWGITVTSVGFQCVDAFEVYPSSDHPDGYYFHVSAGRVLDEYQLVYIVRGEGTLECNGKRYGLSAGRMFMIFPGQWHTYRPSRKTGWDAYWIGFRGSVVDQRVRDGFFSVQSPVFGVGISPLTVEVYRRAMSAAEEEGANYQQMLAGAVALLMGIALNRGGWASSVGNEARDKIARARIIMRDNLSENIGAQEVARRLHVSYSWFRTAFKRMTGMAPVQYMNELKLYRAMEMLSDRKMTIKEIAYALDFNSSRYFSSFFRKRTGYSPVEYRSRMLSTEPPGESSGHPVKNQN